MIFSLAACGGKSPAASADADQPEAIKLGKHTAVFKGYTLTRDEDGSGNNEYMVECAVSFVPAPPMPAV